MLENPIVQQNIAKLRDFGYYVLNTGTGLLACGDLGSGKLLPWNEIVEEIVDILDINNSED
jgi:phosphopantothenoylcysteine decarboxylase/phosphopantothenate--cysteine ligase